MAFPVFADVVHVFEETECGGGTVRVADRMLETGRNYKTDAAPAKSGWIFTHWTISAEQDFENRDVWGRAYDEAPFKLYEETTLTAHYLPKTQDEDGDGLADGYEIYWYGSTDVSPSSDTDGDGLTFAAEVAGGTNPLMADADIAGPVKYVDGALNLYNPSNYGAVVIRSEPEGTLFATFSEVYRPGTKMTTTTKGSFNPGSTSFAYWSFNGVRQADAWGRAVDSMGVVTDGSAMEIVAVVATDYETRMKLYWYGDASVAMTSDTDGDGLTFAQELADGSNPLMADGDIEGPVKYADSQLHEANLQPYERVTGAVIDEIYEEFPMFGSAVTPTVADVDGDGKLDIVVEVAGGETVVYLGCGGEGNPEFRKVAWSETWAPVLAAARPRSLDGLTFDVKPPADALSWSFADVDGDGVEDLLVSDSEGRIWYYKGLKDENDEKDEKDGDGDPNYQLPATNYQLLHKVWGGSYAGFAQGLRIAAVDWDDDGDLDCLAGTAEGKLMLLRDPKVGRPTNLKALVGVDNVKLDWDPNLQSRIRGYKVYRKAAEDAAARWGQRALPTLPTYRDYPEEIADYDYAVSSVSRHYVAGNSTPIESESPKTEAVRASLGKVKFFWNDVAVKQGERAEVLLSIENSLNYDVAGKTQVVTFDPAYLTPLEIVKTGLTENVIYEESVVEGKWTISLKSGKLEAGGGKFFTLVFDTFKAGTTKVGEATVTIVARQEPAPYRLGDVNGDGVVDTLDVRLLAQLKNAAGRKWTANQLKAGDFNGNGKLDNADYQALRELLKERGLL